MFHSELIRPSALLIGLGAAALLSASAGAQSGLSEKRQNFIAFTPGVAGVALGAWITPDVDNGRLHGAMTDGAGDYMLELNGVLTQNHYLVDGQNPQGQTYGVISTYDGYHREPVAYFHGVWEEVQPGQGTVMATLYRQADGFPFDFELAGLMAGDFNLVGHPTDGPVTTAFEGIDGIDSIGLDELDDGPTSVGIDKKQWAGGPPILVSDLMWSNVRLLHDEYLAAGMGDLEQKAWIGGPPIQKLSPLDVAKISKLASAKAKVVLDDDVSIVDGGSAGGIGFVDDGVSVKNIANRSAAGVQSVDGDGPRVGTFRLRWKMFFE